MRSRPHSLWAVLDGWMILDGMLPRPAVGQTWETGLELVLMNAAEVDSSARLTIRIAVDPFRPATPIYEVVGRTCPHPWDGWHVVVTGVAAFVARD